MALLKRISRDIEWSGDDLIQEELKCLLQHNEEQETETNESGCDAKFDSVTCWPPTPPGTKATMPCPVSDITDHTKTATYECHTNGSWARQVNYQNCFLPEEYIPKIKALHPEEERTIRLVYYIGYACSIFMMMTALAIFIYFKNLHCNRNLIHSHLIASFTVKYLLYYLIQPTVDAFLDTDDEWVCKLEITVFNYFHSTNFFWMFVEGFHLFGTMVWTYSIRLITKWHCIIVGWFVPMLFPAIWVIVKLVYEDNWCWLPSADSNYEFIIHGPIIATLVCNFFFMVTIVWKLFTKLRKIEDEETQILKKTARAVLVLFPLLGISFLLLLYSPRERTTLHVILQYALAAIHTLQGILVSVLFCFMNNEVRETVRRALLRIGEFRAFSIRTTEQSKDYRFSSSVPGTEKTTPESQMSK